MARRVWHSPLQAQQKWVVCCSDRLDTHDDRPGCLIVQACPWVQQQLWQAWPVCSWTGRRTYFGASLTMHYSMTRFPYCSLDDVCTFNNAIG